MAYWESLSAEERRLVRKVIVTARNEYLHNEETWTSGTYARSQGGRSVSPLSRRAVKFCWLGALERAAHRDLGLHGENANEAYCNAVNSLADSGGKLIDLNDQGGLGEVHKRIAEWLSRHKI